LPIATGVPSAIAGSGPLGMAVVKVASPVLTTPAGVMTVALTWYRVPGSSSESRKLWLLVPGQTD